MNDKTSPDTLQHLWLEGTVTAVTPLAVSSMDTQYGYNKATKGIQRFPRVGVSTGREVPDAPVYYPATGFSGRLRRNLASEVCARLSEARAEQSPWNLEAFFLNTVGGSCGFPGRKSLKVGLAAQRRANNPIESLFGSVRLGGHLGIGNLYAPASLRELPVQRGVRTNDAARSPETLARLSEAEMERLAQRTQIDHEQSQNKTAIDEQIKAKKAEKNAASGSDKERFEQELAALVAERAQAKAEMSGHVPIQNPWPGYEYLPAGTEMSQRMSVFGANQLEMGFFLAALRAFAGLPRLGGHWRQSNCGWVRCDWSLRGKTQGDSGPVRNLGTLSLSFDDGFVSASEWADECLARYEAAAASGFEGLVFDDTAETGDASTGLNKAGATTKEAD